MRVNQTALRLASVLLVGFVISTAPAEAQVYSFHYAVKVVCGTPEQGKVSEAVSQLYGTAINIHYPGVDGPAVFQKKLVVTLPPGKQVPVAPRPISRDKLPPDWALSSDCHDLRERAHIPPGDFFEGFVLVDSTRSLDIVGVYTVPGGIDVVNVPERGPRR